MASVELFSHIPPFPTDIPVTKMSKISLAKLAAGDEAEGKAVLDASRKLGSFLLDLQEEEKAER